MNGSVVADRIAELLRGAPAFDRLPEEVRRGLLGRSGVRYFEPEEVILEQGTAAHRFLYIVESGYIRLTERRSGRLVDEYGEGDVFGNYGLMNGGPLPHEARAVEPTVCVLVGAEDFQRLYEGYSEFAAFFDKDIKERSSSGDSVLDASSSRLLFRTTLGELVSREPVICTPRATAREAAETMRSEDADSVVVTEGDEVVGILSDMDLRNDIVAEGASSETPVEELMYPNVLRLDAGEPVFQALTDMMQRQTYHVVVSEGPELLGVISDLDISRAQSASPAFVARRADQARSPEELRGIRSEVDELLIGLERQGVRPRDLITINTELNDHLMRRVIALAEAGLREDHPEMAVELSWAWLSLGSEGRGEMSIATDQDNALVYADPASEEEAERAEEWFRTLAERANEALAGAGFKLCPGGIMARNSLWRHPMSGWKKTFHGWVRTPDTQVLAQVSTFFDLRSLYGDMALAEELKQSVLESLHREGRFLPFMAQNALARRPPLSFFRRFVLERSGAYRNTFNIKQRGLRPLVDAARLLAVQLEYMDSANTEARFRHVSRSLPELSSTIEDALDAYHYLSETRFINHLRAVEEGGDPDNHLNPSEMNNTQQSMLKVVFATVQGMQEAMAHRYGINLKM